LARNDYTFLLQLLQNLDGPDSKLKNDDPDMPKNLNETKKSVKIDKSLEEALNSVKNTTISTLVPSLTVKVFIESIQMYLFNDDNDHQNEQNVI
jgi:hypothetical protein